VLLVQFYRIQSYNRLGLVNLSSIDTVLSDLISSPLINGEGETRGKKRRGKEGKGEER
jgi:hypothetical protein